MAQVIVRAIENGHDGVQYRNAGEEFSVDEARLKDGSTWFEPVQGADPEPSQDGGRKK